jgi:hypothetical protein
LLYPSELRGLARHYYLTQVRAASLHRGVSRVMEVTRTGTYSIGRDGRGLFYLENGQFVLRFLAVSNAKMLLMRPGYDVIGEGTAEQTSFPAN